MIFVEPLHTASTHWGGRQSCRMTSDTSVEELLDFARAIGLPLSWYRHRLMSHPHFNLSAKWREAAVAGGARPCTTREYVSAVQRLRERLGVWEVGA